jgi:hypothetical protein
MDRRPRTGTVKRRVDPLFRKGCPLHDPIPHMPEARAWPRVEEYQEIPWQNKNVSQAFGIV